MLKQFISDNWGVMLWLLLSYAMYTTWGTMASLVIFPFWLVAPACKG
jgi:hypothetical protein